MRRPTSLALLSVFVPALLAVPVTTPSSAGSHPVRPGVVSIDVSGVDAASLADSAGPAGARPQVLTGKRATRGFAMFGVTWAQGTGTGEVVVQARTRSDGRWSGWAVLPAGSDDGPDDVADEAGTLALRLGTAPSWVGSADGVQVRLDVVSGPAPEDVDVELVDPGESEADAGLGRAPSSTAHAATVAPPIISRAMWGADESIRGDAPDYASSVRVAYVHHTASTNDYTMAEAAEQVRGFYAYHVKSLGWSDIGYNFLVDKFGRVYEGRYGGISRAVIGAHAGGFNTGTVGVSMIGNYSTVSPSAVQRTSLAQLLAYKLSLDGRDPLGKAVLTSGGGSSSRHPAGASVTVNVIAGHRDTNATACPGSAGYAALPGIRQAVANLMDSQPQATADPIDLKHQQLGGDGGTLGPATAVAAAVPGGRVRTYRGGSIYWSAGAGAHAVRGGILGKYLAVGGPSSPLGLPTTDETGVPDGRMSSFAGGVITWSAATGPRVVRGAVYREYQAQGGPAGPLGLATSDETAAGSGQVSSFRGGSIYWSPSTGAETVRGAILQKYLALGGPTSWLGFPEGAETAVLHGRAAAFQGGNIYTSSATGTHEVHGGILEQYVATGGSAGPLGLPIADESPVAGGAFTAFQYGRVYWSPDTGAVDLYGAVLGRYLAGGAERSALGFPAVSETDVPGGRAATFAGGNVYWSPATGAHSVYGGVFGRYVELGGAAGILGLPTGPEVAVSDGVVLPFKNGKVFWSPETGAYEVFGGILAAYERLGGPASGLGFPASGEKPAGAGRVSDFTGGQIFWSPTTGAHEVRGAIRGAYLGFGGTSSFLGFPTSDETAAPGGAFGSFAAGRIFWSPATGARSVRGGILARYLAEGGPRVHGYPVTDEYLVPGGAASRFQRSLLVWDARTGAISVRPL